MKTKIIRYYSPTGIQINDEEFIGMKSMTTKNFQTNLILDWKSGAFRVVKTIIKVKIKANEIPIQMNIDVEIPEKPIVIAKGKIILKEEKAQQILLDQL